MVLKLRVKKFAEIKTELFIFLMILLSNGMFFAKQIPASIRIIILLMLPFAFFGIKRVKLKTNVAIVAVVFIALQALTVLVNGIMVEYDLFLTGSVLFGVLFCSHLSFDEFSEGYRNILYWIAIISCAIFFINTLFPNWLHYIPSFFFQRDVDKGVNAMTFLWTFVVRDMNFVGYNRNFGIFVEPGQFQIFLIIAFLLEFFSGKKINYKRIVAWAVTLVTCRATTGLLAVLPVVAAYLYEYYMGKKQKVKKQTYLFVFVAVIAGVVLVTAESEYIEKLVNEVLMKLSDMMSYNNSYDDFGTGLERARAIDVAWRVFKANPITGLGYKGMWAYVRSLNSDGFITTFSPLNWFARFGVLFGALTNLFFLSTAYLPPKKLFAKLLALTGLFFSISTQEITSDPFIWVMICFGISNVLNKRAEARREPVLALKNNQNALKMKG